MSKAIIFVKKIREYGIVNFSHRAWRRASHWIRAHFNLDDVLTSYYASRLDFIAHLMPSACFLHLQPAVELLQNDIGSFRAVSEQFDPLLSLEPCWSYDQFSEKTLPNKHFNLMPFSIYNNSGEVHGDFMFPNELNKHGWVPGLALSFLITNNLQYFNKLESLFEDWRNTFPVGWGVPYLTTLNVAQRLIHWLLAIQLLNNNKNASRFLMRLKQEAYREYLFLNTYNTAHYSVQNNYAFCESVAVLMFLWLFSSVPGAKKRSLFWQNRLKQACCSQIDSDGFTIEGSITYSRFIAELLLLAFMFGEEYLRPYLESMVTALFCLSDSNGCLPGFGDVSTERGFDLGGDKNILDSRTFFALTSKALKRSFIKGAGGIDLEYFMFSGDIPRPGKLLAAFDQSRVKHFEKGGYTVFNQSWGNIVVDHADIGLLGKGGHGHCDIGSYCLNDLEGAIVVDPGTYVYSANRALRNLYRSSRMHNISSVDNAEMCFFEDNLFGVSKAPYVKTQFDDDQSDIQLNIFHQGYIVNNKRVSVKREIIIRKNDISIADDISGDYAVSSFIHFAPDISLKENDGIYRMLRGDNCIATVHIPNYLKSKIEEYGYSPSYGKIIKASRLVIARSSKIGYLKYQISFCKTNQSCCHS